MNEPRATLLECVLLATFSLIVHWALFGEYLPAPTSDLVYPISAALNASAGEGLVTIDPRARLPDDLGLVRETFLTTWPPGMTLVYLALLSLGLRIAQASAVIAIVCILAGTAGWWAFFSRLGASRRFLRAFALLSSFLPFGCFALRWLKTDYVVWAAAPWTYLAVVSIFDTSRPHRGRLLLATLLTATLFLVKYSAVTVFLGSSVYALHRAAREKRLPSAALAIAAAAVVCATLLFFNKKLTGQTSAIFSWGTKWCGFRPREILALLALPMEQLTGWDRILDAAGVDGFWVGATAGIASSLIAFWAGRKLAITSRSRETVALLEIQTLCVYGVFLGLTMRFGYCFEWSVENAEQQFRYFAPAMYGWVFVPLILAERQRSVPIGALAALVFALPIFANVGAEASLPLRGSPPFYLPHTGLAWRGGPGDLRFLRETIAEHGEPDMLIAPSPELMPELGIPTLVYRRFWRFRRFESSRELYAWIFVDEETEANLAKAFSNWDVRLVDTPPGFPYALWFARSKADETNPSRMPEAITR